MGHLAVLLLSALLHDVLTPVGAAANLGPHKGTIFFM